MQRSTVTTKHGQGPFWRKQENAAKHGSRLRGWRATRSDVDASQKPYVPNGIKGYTDTAITTTTVRLKEPLTTFYFHECHFGLGVLYSRHAAHR